MEAMLPVGDESQIGQPTVRAALGGWDSGKCCPAALSLDSGLKSSSPHSAFCPHVKLTFNSGVVDCPYIFLSVECLLWMKTVLA